MYNRYIPQSDGSYRRSSVPDSPAPKRPPEPAKQSPPPPPPDFPPPMPPRQQPRNRCPGCRPQHLTPKPPEVPGLGLGSFLRKILPRDFDTGDLLVVILLLLMCADEYEDQSTALLTLALYLFL